MTLNDALALPPGPALDQAVHIFVFGETGKKIPAYSTNDAAGMKILDKVPLFVARVDPAHPSYDPSRQYVAGLLAHNADIKGDVTTLRVTAPTRLVALCKAALLVALRPAKAERAGITPKSSAEAAREVASRIGTPAARNPKTPKVQQPTARHFRDARPPLPKRTGEFVGPAKPAAPSSRA